MFMLGFPAEKAAHNFMKELESYYKNKAKKDCKECEGKGLVWDYQAQDQASLEPCSSCFSEELEVRRRNEERSRTAFLERKVGRISVELHKAPK